MAECSNMAVLCISCCLSCLACRACSQRLSMLTSFFRLRLSASSAPSLLCALMVVLLRRRRCTRRSGGCPSLPAAAAGEAPDSTVMCARVRALQLRSPICSTWCCLPSSLLARENAEVLCSHATVTRTMPSKGQESPICIAPSSNSLPRSNFTTVLLTVCCKNAALTNLTKQLPAQGQLWLQQIQGASVQASKGHRSLLCKQLNGGALKHTSQAYQLSKGTFWINDHHLALGPSSGLARWAQCDLVQVLPMRTGRPWCMDARTCNHSKRPEPRRSPTRASIPLPTLGGQPPLINLSMTRIPA